MASIEGYMDLLRLEGHKLELNTVSGLVMKDIRMKEAELIFKQAQKGGKIEKESVLDARTVDLSDINDNERYYEGFVFVPRIAEHMCRYGRLTSTADVDQCQGAGPQSYGIYLEDTVYESNNQLAPLVSSHHVATENRETWHNVFTACHCILHLDRPWRVTILDQEKSIDLSYRSTMYHAPTFLDNHHVKNNMIPHVGSQKSSAADLYEKALRAPSNKAADASIRSFGPKTTAYCSRFSKKELYRDYSDLEDLFVTSQ